MTEAQKQVLDECHAKLGEHFAAFVIITNANDPSEEFADARISHGGGFYNALGLLCDAQHQYLNRTEHADD